MINFFATRVGEVLTAGIALSIAIAAHTPAQSTGLIQQDLVFGCNSSDNEQVSEEQFQRFVDREITPRFPAGLTIFNADRQLLNSSGVLIREPSNAVTLLIENTVENEKAIDAIVTAYLQHCNQASVLHVKNEDEFKVAFGSGEDIIDNESVPEFIEAELFFGRNIPGGGEVSEQQFQAFVDTAIAPRLSTGLTIFDASGQFQDSTDTIIEEQSKVVRLLLKDTVANEQAIDDVIDAYMQQFNQESVLLTINEEIAVGFGAGENLIDHDSVPEFIQVDLFFDRNRVGDAQVSDIEFQAFVDSIITPLFPTGFIIFDATRQVQDSSPTNIEDASKVLRLFLEDTIANEDAIDQVIRAYSQQFNSKNVLLVIDEEIEVTFGAELPNNSSEPNLVLELIAAGAFGTVLCLKKHSIR